MFVSSGGLDQPPRPPGSVREPKGSAPARATLAVIRFYQVFVARALPPACRFQPTCSVYAYAAVERHGLRRGGALALRRLARCHPFGGHGYDPVP